jgi:acyl-CoA thioester hydrolase
MDAYWMPYQVRWADLDANGHVSYSAYIDATADLRYRYFAQHGYPPERFKALGLGAVYTSLSATFLREVMLGETLKITYLVAGLSPGGARWRVRHDIMKETGKVAVRVTLEGVLMNLATRKPALPTPELLEIYEGIPRSADFEVLADGRWVG